MASSIREGRVLLKKRHSPLLAYLEKGYDAVADFVADGAEDSHLLLFRPGGVSGIAEGPMQGLRRSGKDRA